MWDMNSRVATVGRRCTMIPALNCHPTTLEKNLPEVCRVKGECDGTWAEQVQAEEIRLRGSCRVNCGHLQQELFASKKRKKRKRRERERETE